MTNNIGQDEFENGADYPVIRVDMDYCSDPLWGSADKKSGFCNLSLEDFEKVLSKELMHSLAYYQHSWEMLHSSKYLSVFEDHESSFLKGLHVNLLKAQIEITKQLKREMPDKVICFAVMNDLSGYQHNEILLVDGKVIITEMET